MKRAHTLFVVFWLVMSVVSARAALSLVLSPAAQNSATGVEVVFSGTLTNTSASSQIFLNDLQISGGPAQLTLKPNTFFANVPGILLPGESYTGPIFSVIISSGAPAGDYAATVSVLYGADIFALNNTASASFAVLSPAVNITATDSDASEYGPATGQFTISRTGLTDTDLPVAYTIGGSAVNGVSYQTIPLSASIPAGSSSAAVTILPIPDNVAEGDRSVTLLLSSSPAFNPGTNTSATVTIHDKPADEWRIAEFGAAANTPAASDAGDWDGDGITNLFEYALGFDPKTPNASGLPVPLAMDGYLTISYAPNAAAVDVDFVVEGSADLVHWSTANVEAVSIANPQPPNLVTYRYNQPMALVPEAFLRVRVTRRANP